ncbi:MAG: sulfatase-like hydrolase/transferase [Rikenellaceae bacterium]
MIINNKLIFATALTSSLAGGVQFAFCKSESPNIIVIVADDMGYGALGAYGGKEPLSRTPNLDQFAEEGIRFTDGYVSASTSGPSRAGILTGRYQQRFGIYANCDLQNPGTGVPEEVVMMPQLLKETGYNTAAIGKWHSGHEPGMIPLNKGFDEFFGFYGAQSNFFDDEDIKELGIKIPRPSKEIYDGLEVVNDYDYLTYEFTDRAVDFIERNRDEKFMLYLAYNAVHDPVQVPEEEAAKFSNVENIGFRNRAAMLHTLDAGIGRVISSLKEHDIDDNTLIIFLSDNGGLPNWWEGNNGVLRGNKRQRWEGGIRVAYMMRYPNGIDKGQVRGEMVSAIDILPTALDVANIDPTEYELDGVSMTPLFKKRHKEEIHDYLFWAGGNNYNLENGKLLPIPSPGSADNPPAAWAVRSHQWKLVHFNQTDRTYLFDMSRSAEESDQMDLYDQHPEVVADLTSRFKSWFNDVHQTPLSWHTGFYNELVEFTKE